MAGSFSAAGHLYVAVVCGVAVILHHLLLHRGLAAAVPRMAHMERAAAVGALALGDLQVQGLQGTTPQHNHDRQQSK